MQSQDYPLILVIGKSGSGKSISARNLNPKTTAIIDIERKPLPFKNAFKDYKINENIFPCETFQQVIEKLKLVLDSKQFDTIFIDSGLKFSEILLVQSKIVNKGYDIYNYFNDYIGKFLEQIKKNKNKIVVVTWIDELVKEINPSGSETTSRRAAISGKQWEGKIEKEFAIVLFTDVKQEKGKSPVYSFITNNDGTNSAKSPPDMFNGEQIIDNDLNRVIDRVHKYYEISKLSGINSEETIVLNEKL